MTLCHRCKREMKPVPIVDKERASSIILEMKVESGSRTDTELARYLERDPSAVAQWRRRGAVPEAATIDFETKRRA